MVWTAEVTTINQVVNIGAESTSALGTSVAASKRVNCFDWTFTPMADVKMYRPTGHRYSTIQEENMEWMEMTLGGAMDYNGLTYILNSAMGSVAPATHGTSGTAKDWVFTPPIVGPSVVPQTYTIEQGDAVRAHKLTYGLLNDYGFTMSRKDTSVAGKGIGLAIADNITLTSSPTAIALAPIVGKHVNVYLDNSSANLGVTQLTRAFTLTYDMSNIYGPFWPLNRTNVSWTAHVDLAPKVTMKLLVEADGNGMALLGYLQTGATYWLRINAQGLVIDNQQTGTITGAPTGGTFTLTYKGQTTAGIAFNATSATVQTAFRLLSTVPATTTVTGGAGGPYSIVFSPTDTLAQDTTAITASGAGLTGGSSPTITITQTQSYNTYQHDMAVKVTKPNPFKDEQGIFAMEWELEIVEDGTWGKAQTVTLTNLLTAL